MNPAIGEGIDRLPHGGAEEARDAVAAVLRALRGTEWKSDGVLRSRVLNKPARRFEARADTLIQLLSTENGGGSRGHILTVVC